jgi:predicted DNA-binding protein (MmcQ/YjbR family)
MTLDSIRAFCTSLPHVTEKVQWGDDLVFKVGGKMFCVAYLGVPTHLSFRPSEEHRIELLEIEGVIPAPYMARAGWVSVREMKAVNAAEILRLLFRQAAQEDPGATAQQKIEEESLI